MTNYKDGDRVRCVDPGTHPGLTKNKIYICTVSKSYAVGIIADNFGIKRNGFFNYRFEKAISELSSKIRIL